MVVFEREGSAHLVEVSAAPKAAGLGHGVGEGGGFRDPQMQVPPALVRDLAQRGGEETDADLGVGLAVVGADHDLDAPGVMTPAELRVADQRPVGRLSGDEAGEALATPMHQVEPLVLTERVVAVGDERLLEELGHLGDVGLAHAALDLDGVHRRRLPNGVCRPRPLGPVRRLGTVRSWPVPAPYAPGRERS